LTDINNILLDYVPQARQWKLHNARARQILYGGAAGGGKSHATRWDAIIFALLNPGFSGYLFRRKRTELIGTHIRRIKQDLGNTGLGQYSETRNAFEFYNGSVIYMCFADQEDDVHKYLSEEMHWVGFDEASQMTPTQLGFIITRSRLGGWKPTENDGRLPRIIFATNPGGPSHSYLKRKFKMGIIPAEQEFNDDTMVDPRLKDHKGWTAIFIPASMSDNSYLDLDYGAAFGALSPELREAYANGNWDVVVGQAIHNLSRAKHCIRQWVPPAHWTKFMAIDWGMAKPFSIGWYCVSEGGLLKDVGQDPSVSEPAGRYIPAGAVVRFHEWYGWNGKEDQGCRLDPLRVAQEIKRIESELGIRVDYRVADTEMWGTKGGPSPMDYFGQEGIYCRQSVKDRARNYNEMISRLAGATDFQIKGVEGEHPMFFITANCEHFWRTVPTLQIDGTSPEKGPSDKEENHCFAGDTPVIIASAGTRAIKDVKLYDAAMTLGHWRRVVPTPVTERLTLDVTLSDGFRFRVTPNHRFFVGNAIGYKISLDKLAYNMYLRGILELEEECLSYLTERVIINAGTIGKIRENYFTGKYGSFITDLLKKVIISTTKMEIGITTRWKILKHYLRAVTCLCTAKSVSTMPNGTCEQDFYQKQQSGTEAKKGLSGILSKVKGQVRYLQDSLSFAKYVAKKDWLKSETKGFALTNVNNKTSEIIIQDIRLGFVEKVYNIHVIDGPHNYALGNGTVVANCYDECAYALASYPYITDKRTRDDIEFEEKLTTLQPNGTPYQTIFKTNRQRSGRKSLWH
jgi:hypothetical protein